MELIERNKYNKRLISAYNEENSKNIVEVDYGI